LQTSHTIGAIIAFVAGAIVPIASYKITESPFKYLGVIIGGISILAIVLFFAFAGSQLLTTSGSNYFGIGVGGMERMIVYPTIIWTVGLGGNLMSS
jgi:hypothetical protein